jgi:hypothetical protein
VYLTQISKTAANRLTAHQNGKRYASNGLKKHIAVERRDGILLDKFMTTLEFPPSRLAGTASTLMFERAVQTTEKHRAKNRVVLMVAQWEVLISVFKHAVEIPSLLELDEAPTKTQHRTILTSLLNIGEIIWGHTNEGQDPTIIEAGYDEDFISANLNYLRAKYQQWYADRDDAAIEQNQKIIWDALSAANK